MKRRTVVVAVAGAILAAVLASQGPRLLSPGTSYVALLPDAAGLRAGDDVRAAGITIGRVAGVSAEGAVVKVRFHLDAGRQVTDQTQDQVKLGSLLGQRFLSLDLHHGSLLASGGTLPLRNAIGSYTLERFWLDNSNVIGDLDLRSLSSAVDVLSHDLNGDPGSTRAALAGMSAVTDMVTKRDGQLTQLLTETHRVTDQVVGQSKQLTDLMTSADQIFQMVRQRQGAINALLRDSRALIVQLSAMARRNAAPMQQALRQLKTILAVLKQNRDQLKQTLELAEPAMRLYTNSGGDGPWLGVNAPYLVFPDSLWCLYRKELACR